MASNIDVIFTKNGIIQLTDSFNGLVGSSGTVVNTKTVSGQIDAYTRCSVVQDAIDLKTSYITAGKVAAIDDSGKWINGNYDNYPDKKKVEEITELFKNINYFNEYESAAQHRHRRNTYKYIFGKAYVHKEKMLGIDKYQYHLIPNNIIMEEYHAPMQLNPDFTPKVKRYLISVGTDFFPLTPDEVYVFKDSRVGFHNKTTLSRLHGLEEAISTLLCTNEMLTQLLADGGARGIITQGASNIDMISAGYLDEEKADIQRSLKDYGLLKDKYKYIVTKGQAGYVPLTSRIVDMQIPEIALMKKIEVYRGFGIQTAFAINEARFKVIPEARKEMVTSSVAGEGASDFKQELLMKGIPELSYCSIDMDYSHFDFFMESQKDKAVAFQQFANGLKPLVEANILTTEQAQNYIDFFV